MKLLTVAVILWLSLLSHAFASEVRHSTDRFGPFGVLHIYQTSGQPKHIALFLSGDGGWNRGVADMARSLAEDDSMIVGIDITHYIGRLNAGPEKCAYPAAHFEELSQYLQHKHHFPRYVLPALVGYSSGATLVYATLAQSPPNTFAGGISIGFCPDLKTATPLCKGSGALTSRRDGKLGFIYGPAALAAKLYVLQGDVDKVCSTPDTRAFLSKVDNVELIELPKVGHGFSVRKNWMPQLKRAFRTIVAQGQGAPATPNVPDELGDLPLVVLPGARDSDTLAVVVSGDGGWASIDKSVAEKLNGDGVSVVGLNSLQYFWNKKEPDVAAKDLMRILNHYSRIWRTTKYILVGYSSGADTLPFMVSRLPDALKSRVKVVALLGLSKDTDFEIHVSDWILNTEGAHKVIPEVQRLKSMKVLCIYGEDEDDSACKMLDQNEVTSIEVKGGHHFGGDYEKLANTILDHSR